MLFIIALVVLTVCVSAQAQVLNVQNAGRGQYVYDLLRPQLDAASVVDILLSAQPGVTYPNYASVPQTNFVCPQQPGFYVDVNAQCQVFHRCDINGLQTSYLCANTTVFNQITLVCDYFFNVNCEASQQYANYANSRLYTDQPLFDTPPADYIAPSQILAQQQQEQLNGAAAVGSQNQVQGKAQAGQNQGVRVNQGVGTQNQIRVNQNTRFTGRAGATATNQNQVQPLTQGNLNNQQAQLSVTNSQQLGTTQQTVGTAEEQGTDQDALTVQVQGNGQVSQAQVKPGQTATLQAGGTAITATNNNGDAAITTAQ